MRLLFANRDAETCGCCERVLIQRADDRYPYCPVRCDVGESCIDTGYCVMHCPCDIHVRWRRNL